MLTDLPGDRTPIAGGELPMSGIRPSHHARERADVAAGAPERVSSVSHPWLGIGMRQLAVFDAVVRRSSFRNAAREIGYVQSAVSRQVTRLERTVGTRLIDRGRGRDGVSLTPAGELLAEHGRAVLAQLRAARIDVETVSRASGPALHLGLCPGVAPWLVPSLISLLSRRRPELRLEFLEITDEDELPALVERGMIDLAVGSVPPDSHRLASTPLVPDPWIVLARADSLVAHRDPVCSVAELQATSIVLPPRSRAADLAACQLEAAGVDVHDAARVPPGRVMRAAIVSGGAVALAPALSVLGDEPGLAVLTPGVTLTPRDVGVFWSLQRRTVDLLEDVRDAVCEAIDARVQHRVAVVV